MAASTSTSKLTLMTIIIVFSTLVHSQINSIKVKGSTVKKSTELCQKLGKEPYFDLDMVVSRTWRIYYTWPLNLQNICMDLIIRNATPALTQRFWNDMYEYLETQPAWDAATLHMTFGGYEMLFFADQGPAGSFAAVPNVVRNNLPLMKSEVTLLKFYMKLLSQGRFLLMMDCMSGIVNLSAQPNRIPYKSEILKAIGELGLGDGFPACVSDFNKDERISY